MHKELLGRLEEHKRKMDRIFTELKVQHKEFSPAGKIGSYVRDGMREEKKYQS